MIAGDSGVICSHCVASSQKLLASGGEQPEAPTTLYLFQLLDSHFAPEKPASLQVTSRTFQIRQQADLQLALNELFGERVIGGNFIGVHSEYRHEAVTFSRLIERKRGAMQASPAQFQEVDIGGSQSVRCLKNGVWLLKDGGRPYTAVLETSNDYGNDPKLTLEIAGAGAEGLRIADQVFATIERRLSKDSCYRGRVLSLEQENQWSGQLTGHTTLLITADGVGLLPDYIALARLLQPALVVIEDADLIARARTEMGGPCEEVMLNRLLNELDGLRERADIFFVLTTNRPEELEPALASRPGRIDQSIEFPLPDEGHRIRLLRLYGQSIPVQQALLDDLATRTHGATPAFIKEFMRRIAQNYLEAGSPAHVTQAMAQEALHDMLFTGGALNKKLLGGSEVHGE